ncbi:hypothetical protein EV424DRAFT_712742 [Suillus variegatus]|nr:hypothetical protein EV424DRAFT_712742 [Suillus variegatus]
MTLWFAIIVIYIPHHRLLTLSQAKCHAFFASYTLYTRSVLVSSHSAILNIMETRAFEFTWCGIGRSFEWRAASRELRCERANGDLQCNSPLCMSTFYI